MRAINLYEYKGSNGTIVSPVLPPMDYKALVRLIADDNKILFNGTDYALRIDISLEDMPKWMEIDIPEDLE